MTDSSHQRWDELLDSLVGLLPAGPASVLVDGDGDQPATLARRLAAALNTAGHSCYRLPGTEPGPARDVPRAQTVKQEQTSSSTCTTRAGR